MRVLIFCPQSREYADSLDSIRAIQTADGIEADWLFCRTGDVASAHRYDNCTAKCERGRLLALAGNYDALLIVDDDMIFPADTLVKLAALPGDIHYGLYVWRTEPRYWIAMHSLDERSIVPYGAVRGDTAEAWGKVLETPCAGSGCTFIRRPVLERVTFHRRGSNCFDWYLSVDAQALGFRQLCDTTVLCGHLDPAYNRVLWPDVNGYRVQDWNR